MIERTIYRQILHSISLRPVTLITGARQVGKTTLCLKLRDEQSYNYVSLRNQKERSLARSNPSTFLDVHPWPLIIDEVQYAPNLLEYIESIIDDRKVQGEDNKGMYVLTGSQAYKLMDGVTDSLAGRVSIVNMSPLSMSEVIGRVEVPFNLNLDENIQRSKDYNLSTRQFFERVLHGMYPEPEVEENLTTEEFYSDYVETYINRDVTEIINIRNKEKFHIFLQLVASLTGQELNYEKISSDVGVDGKTIKEWISVLIAGDIIHLLQPYSDRSTSKRVVKRPKLYFWDTGLACYLARVLDVDSLMAGYLKGAMTETFMVNEILKTYRNAKMESPFYYYRDGNNKEIDLVMVKDGKISLIECKSGIEFGWNDIKAMAHGIPSQYPIGSKCVMCLTDRPYPIKDDIYALPVTSI